jgi:hypothetical protein
MSTRLGRLARQATAAASAAQEHCELCAEVIPVQHRHLLEVATRNVQCVCYPCSILFDRAAASQGRLWLIPDRRLYLPGTVMTDSQWDGLRIPVGLAFVFYSTPEAQAVALYPGPMGTTQALLDQTVWTDIRSRHPVLASMQPDVEAVLINRARSAREHYLVPIDDCFRLVAIIRMSWRGLTGGGEVWREVADYFTDLRARSRIVESAG